MSIHQLAGTFLEVTYTIEGDGALAIDAATYIDSLLKIGSADLNLLPQDNILIIASEIAKIKKKSKL